MFSRVAVEIRRTSPQAPWTYALKDQRQRQIAQAVREGRPGALLLSEVEPVITLGRRATPESAGIRMNSASARSDAPVGAHVSAQGIPILPTDRGGLATYHGPGQWVVFWVESLERLTGDSRGVRKAVCQLLHLAREACLELEPELEIREDDETGLWCPRGKLAAIGIHVERGVLLHGLALNCVRRPESFADLAHPCGLTGPGQGPAFLSEGMRASEASPSRFMSEIAERLVRSAQAMVHPA